MVCSISLQIVIIKKCEVPHHGMLRVLRRRNRRAMTTRMFWGFFVDAQCFRGRGCTCTLLPADVLAEHRIPRFVASSCWSHRKKIPQARIPLLAGQPTQARHTRASSTFHSTHENGDGAQTPKHKLEIPCILRGTRVHGCQVFATPWSVGLSRLPHRCWPSHDACGGAPKGQYLKNHACLS